jgi:hypothetical protein
MSRLLLHATPLVALWATVVGKFPALRRDPQNGALRAYWLAVLAVALAWTVLQPPVHLALDRMTGVANLARLLGHTLAVAAACAGQAFLAYSAYPEAAARPRVQRQVWVAAATVADGHPVRGQPSPSRDAGLHRPLRQHTLNPGVLAGLPRLPGG